MAAVIKTTFQFKRATAERWRELNIILAPGEPGYEKDTGRLKIGNGETPWLELAYIGGEGVGLTEAEIINLIQGYTTDFVDIDELDEAVDEAVHSAFSQIQIIHGGNSESIF